MYSFIFISFFVRFLVSSRYTKFLLYLVIVIFYVLYVCFCIYCLYRKKEKQPDAYNHIERIRENIWKYCKKYFETNETVLPTFSENDCWKHFMKTCHEPKLPKVFNISSWIKQLEEHIKYFSIKPPTCNEINKTIMNKMKSAGSSCPINQVRTLMLKKCPRLRTTVWKVCCYCWENDHVPTEWENNTTIRIHKKSNTDDPSNFRPITLDTILSKVMTSYIENRIFSLLSKITT